MFEYFDWLGVVEKVWGGGVILVSLFRELVWVYGKDLEVFVIWLE